MNAILILRKCISFIAKLKGEQRTNLIWLKRKIKLRKQILSSYKYPFKDEFSDDIKEIVNFLKRNRLRFLSYEFVKDYSPTKVKIEYDHFSKMYFTSHEGKCLYYRKDWKKRKIRKYHAHLLAEQDPNSPHCYLTREFNFKNNTSFVDLGAAEGFFSLSIIDKAQYGYIIEPDPAWIDPLKETFKPWMNKVDIIQKKIGIDKSGNNNTLDQILLKKKIEFMKVDVEGWEREVLEGSNILFSENIDIKIVIATYHKQNDEKTLSHYLQNSGFITNYSKGFIINYYDKKIVYPFLRRGLIRAVKHSSPETTC